jgi:hypothetical protein
VARHVGPLLGAAAVLLAPQAAPAVGSAGAVALIAAVCAVVTALTIASRGRQAVELKS